MQDHDQTENTGPKQSEPIPADLSGVERDSAEIKQTETDPQSTRSTARADHVLPAHERSNDTPGADLQFRWPWRPYQQRVLDAIDRHLTDDRLHVVAAPGAGKTVLGLEVFRKLNQPAVVFSPTRIIRDQWLERLRDFLPESAPRPDWTSKKLDEPAFFTSLTYQALHAFNKRSHNTANISGEQDVAATDENDEAESGSSEAGAVPKKHELDAAAQVLKDAGVKTIILDEAHHLRASWWLALHALVEQIDDVKVVSLTGTPPYDVSPSEWHRYELLCGPIDEEIAIPELVYANTLAPHQDFIWVVRPREAEHAVFEEIEQNAESLISELKQDRIFQEAVTHHAWVTEPDNALVTYADADFVMGLLSYAATIENVKFDELCEYLLIRRAHIPALDRELLQALLHSYLFIEDGWPTAEKFDEHRKLLKRKLRSQKLLYRNQLRLLDHPGIERSLGLSAAKLDACSEIYRMERDLRGNDMRLAVLVDYVREGDSDSLGAWPLFLCLSAPRDGQSQSALEDIGLLTGRLMALHESRLERLHAILGKMYEDLKFAAIKQRPGYCRIVARGGSSRLVTAFTQLIREGDVHCIIGTRSLLGEGWDAPEINALILATSVGSFMSTNQMRGRAIRRSALQPLKIASIWHIACVDFSILNGLKDFKRLAKRFDTFVGVANESRQIRSGIERLALPSLQSEANLAMFNLASRKRHALLASVKDLWESENVERATAAIVPVVTLYDVERAMEGAYKPPEPPSLRTFYLGQVKRSVQLGSVSFLSILLSAAAKFWLLPDIVPVYLTLFGFGLGTLFAVVSKLFNYLGDMVRHIPPGGTLREMCFAVRDALHVSGLLEGDPESLIIKIEQDENGAWSAAVTDGSFHDRAMISDAIAELLNPIVDQRYLITRSRHDGAEPHFHAIPTELAKLKKNRETFRMIWSGRMAGAKIIDTYQADGAAIKRQISARNKLEKFAHAVHRSDRWE